MTLRVDLVYEEEADLLKTFFRQSEAIQRLRHGLEQAPGSADSASNPLLAPHLPELSSLYAERARSRPYIERLLGDAIAQVVLEENLPFSFGPVHFPPVDFKFEDPPRLLVISPRNRIERLENILLRPQISARETNELEASMLRALDLSALVLTVGGIATYPAMVPTGRPLRDTVIIASHEWLHHYLFFRPLGQHLQDSAELFSLNETLANIFADEAGGG